VPGHQPASGGVGPGSLSRYQFSVLAVFWFVPIAAGRPPSTLLQRNPGKRLHSVVAPALTRQIT